MFTLSLLFAAAFGEKTGIYFSLQDSFTQFFGSSILLLSERCPEYVHQSIWINNLNFLLLGVLVEAGSLIWWCGAATLADVLLLHFELGVQYRISVPALVC